MADIRINKLIRKYNIGLQELVDFLQKLGAQVDANPNAKVSDEYVPELDKHFSKDLAMKEASEKIDIKLNEILEKTSRKQQEKAEEEDEEPEMETIIKSRKEIGGPLEQFGTVGTKFEMAAKILYQERMLRVMSCSASSDVDEAN